MAIFSHAARTAYLENMGDDAAVGTYTLKVDFSGPLERVRGAGGDFDSEEPTALANPEDITLLGITAGNSGTEIEIMGATWLITAIEPDESGFVVLHLGKP
jgi:hypothetical protein